MKIGNGLERKLRYGSTSVGFCALVIAAVILLNVVFGALCSGRLWFIDLTPLAKKAPSTLYTLSPVAEQMVGEAIASANANREEGEAPVTVDIIFCNDPDMLIKSELMRYIYYTALEIEKAYPDTVKVSTRDVWNNPSSVDEFRTNSYSSIQQSNVIVSSGTEFRVYSYRSFYTYSETTDAEPWAYEGEKNFVKGITAVTRAESPICALTVNHGEPFATEEGRAEYSEFLGVLDNAGYKTVFLDLENEEIPENCRLIITFDPQKDFVTDFYGGTVSELKKLDGFLDKAYSFMVFADADTPKLRNLEEYLEEWGIVFSREGSATYEVVDPSNSLNGTGTVMIGQYESEGIGGELTKDMREKGASPKVVFGNALAIAYSPTYQQIYVLADEETGSGAYTYASYFRNNKARALYDVFRTGNAAYAYAKENGERLTDANGQALVVDTAANYGLMTITQHRRAVSEGQGYTNVYDNSYVCAVGSTEFASNAVLSTNAYGNTDVLLGTLRAIGREIEGSGIVQKAFYDPAMNEDFYTPQANVAITVVLVLLPALTLGGAGLIILIRRRVRG